MLLKQTSFRIIQSFVETGLLFCLFFQLKLYAIFTGIIYSLFLVLLNSLVNELWNEVKFNDRDPHWYTRRVKEAIHIRLHPNNINRDNGIDIPEAWILTVK